MGGVEAERGALGWREIASIARAARPDFVRAALESRGARASPRVVEALARLLELPSFPLAAERVIALLGEAASPERAMLALEDAARTFEEERGDASLLFVEPILRLFLQLAGASSRAANLLVREPRMAIELGARFASTDSAREANFGAAFAQIVGRAAGDTEVFDRLLRRYRNRQMVRIALRELREGDVRETSGELADLAAGALQAALTHHTAILEGTFGRPDPPCTPVIFGMGKLGGRELNFSSDIDLTYFYAHDEGRAGELSLHPYFVKLFERVTASIARITELGFVFRVDLDLRPEGRSGALANSLASAERYYETWGRTWERAAWIKGRAVAGDLELGARILEMLRPFVWRKSFDLRAIHEIVEMKAKIDVARSQAARSAFHRGLDLKLGEGGIREIEFFVQAYQLLHGGRDAQLRHANTLEALVRLEAAGLIRARTRHELAEAYLFLRKVEHRVQIVDEQKTHVLPEDPEARAALARSLGLASADALVGALQGYMFSVHQHFAHLLGSAREEDPLPPGVDAVLDPATPEADALSALATAGARDPHAALANLRSATRHPRSPLHPRAPEVERAIGRRLLAECWASPSVDRAMKHLPDFVRALIAHGSYVEKLGKPALCRGVARVLGASDLLARILVSSPALLQHVLIADTLPTADALEHEIEARLADARGGVPLEAEAALEAQLGVLRSVKQEETLRTAIADLAGLIDVAAVNERLTVLAERSIRAAWALAEAETVARYGRPRRRDGTPASLVVIAGGTLGAREMGYRSDVDLSFVYDEDGETTGGERGVITTGELYTRLAQRLLSFLSLRMLEGDLYPVDMRLRPSGNKGALVATLSNFERYHEESAQLWERQALVRARVIAGAPALAEKVDGAIARGAYEAPLPPDASRRIHEMRLRMERERRSPLRRRFRAPGQANVPERGAFDLKLGEGGIIEAEFLVQSLLLAHGRERPELRTTSTRRALAGLGAARVLPKSRAERLIRAYDRLRRLQNWLRIAHDEVIDHVDLADDALRPLALAVGYQGAQAERLLERDLAADTAAIHLCYTEVLGT